MVKRNFEDNPVSSHKELSLSVVHILSTCSLNLRKGLQQEFYHLNDRCEIIQNKVFLLPENLLDKFFGSRINVQAVVGVNGSGKSSLFEIIYRVINNLSCLLNRGKRRKTAADLCYINGLYAEIYYILDGLLARISCLGDKVEFQLGDEKPVVLTAFDKDFVSSEKVIMVDFVKWARNNLFFTIVTNYSIQAFNANDYKREGCLLLDNQKSKQEAECDADGKVWMNGLFHKNDGYMTPIVLNPYRDNGIFNMNKELHLTLYRLSAIMIYAERHGRDFMEDYSLNNILYTFDEDSLARKYLEDYRVSREIYSNYHYQFFGYMDLGSKMLQAYGVTDCLDFQNKYQRVAAMYLIYKTFSIANSYPVYEEFSDIGELDEFTQQVSLETEAKVDKLVKTILKDHSHISLKIRQTLHFLKALQEELVKKPYSSFDKVTYDEYFQRVFRGSNNRSMREIQEYLPPSFFTIEILMDRYRNGVITNETPIPLEQMSAGERQYLYTFSTYIYHILNLLSIQESHRVKYRNINLILDEVEICFHPEYQRRFVNELLGYIKRLSMNRWASYNIMIATHSPFVLSDIPQGNILYLEDGKMVDSKDFKNPFAANICDILYQSFFLKNGFVGEFARKKINRMINNLLLGSSFLDKYKQEYELLMNLIGDPFLKMQLQQLYEDGSGKK